MAIWFVYLHIWYFLKSGDRCWSFIPQCGLCRLPTWGVYTMCILYIQWNIHSIYSVECCHSSLQYEFLFVVLWSLYHTCHARQLSLANWENAALARSRHTLRLVIADICHLYHLDIKFYAPYVIKNLCKPQLRLYQCSNSSFKLYDDLRILKINLGSLIFHGKVSWRLLLETLSMQYEYALQYKEDSCTLVCGGG